MNEQEYLEYEKEGLINLITWYRDEYHGADWCHSQMIEEIKQLDTIDKLDFYWQAVDRWLD